MGVLTKAKDLATYLFTVTERSPKRFRFTLVSRMQNASLDILDGLYAANDVWIEPKEQEAKQLQKHLRERRDFQQTSLASAKRLDYLLTLAREQGRFCRSSRKLPPRFWAR